jgi:Fe-S cluster assembly protein SufD
MTDAQADALARYRGFIAQAQDDAVGGGVKWFEQQRAAAAARFESLGFPSRKDEGWRYTNLEGLLGKSFSAANEAVAAAKDGNLAALVADRPMHRLVLVNGRVAPDLSQLQGLPAGVQIAGLGEALDRNPDQLRSWLGQAAGEAEHAFSALNSAAPTDGVFVHLAAGCRLDTPIEVVFLTGAADTAVITQPRSLVVLEEGAEATLVERYAGTGSQPCFTNTLVEVLVGKGAALEHFRLQDESAGAYHISTGYVRQAGESRYRGTFLALGEAWSRAGWTLSFADAGAAAELDGLYLVGDRRFADMHIDVRHEVPDCSSRQNFKGIVLGRGRAVFDGRIVVERDAQRTDAHLSNANLLLSRSAEVDTKPQLEIYADDVKCSHGTTVGQLDPQQIFYLRSRGIAEDEARKMLCLGFAGEIMERCRLDGLREGVEQRVRTLLDAKLPQPDAAAKPADA